MTTEMKTVLCKHCEIEKEATKANFYSCYGKLRLECCKECKKAKSRATPKKKAIYVYVKNTPLKTEYMRIYMREYYNINKEKINSVDRKEYNRNYQRKYRLQKKDEFANK